jgi:sugar diacid utilization regulator
VRRVLTIQSKLLDRLIDAVSRSYKEELASSRCSRRELRVLQVEQLLAGDIVESRDLGYEFNAWHLALIIASEQPHAWHAAIVARFVGEVLTVERSDTLIWVWLGAPARHTPRSLATRLKGLEHLSGAVALGEMAPGHAGFRRSHEQAQSAHRVALHVPKPLTLFADEMLLSTAIAQQDLGAALEAVYLAPIRDLPEGTELLETLRAYVASQRNISGAARQQGIHRHTVERHLRTIEGRIGRPICNCTAEIEIALRLDEALAARGPAREA